MKRIFFLLMLILTVSLGLHAQKISPYLFGQNHWIGEGDETGRPGYIGKLWPKVEESGIQFIRIGGNNYNNKSNPLFDDDRLKLRALIDSIHGIGAEPIMQVPSSFTVEEATKLIKDFNYADGRGIRYYSIGNEPICNNHGTIDEVHKYLIRLAPAMKAADPSIKIFVFDACTFYEEAHAALCGGRLDITGKDKNGNWMIDGFAFHNYPNGRKFDRDNVIFSGPGSIRRQAQKLVEMMAAADEKHGRSGEAKLVWGLTEVNVTYANPDREISGYGNPSFLGGQFIAEIYGIGMQYGAFTVAPWCISETDRISSDFGYIGLPSEFYPRSSYYHTQLMSQNMKGAFLPTECNNSYVKSIASISDSEICIMILNEDKFHDFDFDLLLDNASTSAKPLIVRANIGIDAVVSGSIQNQTTIMYVLSKSGKVLRQYTYGLEQNLKYLPPELQNLGD